MFLTPTLCLLDTPSQPGTPEVAQVTSDLVTLHWTPPKSDGHSSITHYILEYHDKDEFLTWHVIEDYITSTTHTITNTLLKNKQYNFKVTAVNEVGPSKPSNPSKFFKMETPKMKSPPVILEPLQSTVIGLKKPLTLSCAISGEPKPQITWLKNEVIITDDNRTFENCVAKYFISETTETSAAEYKVTARNSEGIAETSCTVTVQEPPCIKILPPDLSQKLKVKDSLEVEVTITSWPISDIRWFKNKVPLKSGQHCEIENGQNNSKIKIKSLIRGDSGVYQIFAQNTAGEAEETFNLRVYGEFYNMPGWLPLTFHVHSLISVLLFLFFV